MKTFWSIVLACIFSMSIPREGEAQSQYRFQHYDTKDGLASDIITSMAVDSLGFMWFGHPTSLSRFDGYSFKTYKYDGKDPGRKELNPYIYGTIFSDFDGNVWITEQKQDISIPRKFVKYDWRTDSFVKYEVDLKGTLMLRSRMSSKSPLIWVGTVGGGLLSYNMQNGETTWYLDPGDREAMIRLHGKVDLNGVRDMKDMGDYVLLTTDRGLLSLDKSTRKLGRPPCNPWDSTLLYQTRFWTFMEGHKDDPNIWLKLGKGEGMIKLDSSLSVVNKVNFPEGVLMQWYHFDGNTVWFTNAGKGNKGIWRYDIDESKLSNILSDSTDPNSLPEDRIWGLNMDRNGNVWVRTSLGVSKLLKQTTGFIDQEIPRLQGNTLYKAKGKEFLLLTQSGVTQDLPNNILVAPVGKGQPGDLVFTKLETEKVRGVAVQQIWQGAKYLWLGVAGVGGRVVGFPVDEDTGMPDEKNLVTYVSDITNSNTIGSYMCNGIWEDGSTNLWVGHLAINLQPAGISIVSPKVKYGTPGSVVRYERNPKNPNSIVNNSIFDFYPENDSSVWVVTVAGTDLMHIETEGRLRFEHVFSEGNNPNTIYRTTSGEMLYGNALGLYHLSRGTGTETWIHKPILETIGAVNQIQEDRAGRLWLIAESGERALYCYDKADKTIIQLNPRDGINTKQLRGWLRHTADGRMIIVGQKGISVFDPLSIQMDKESAVPIITGLFINNKKPVIGEQPLEEGDFVMNQSITAAHELLIDYQHNNFTLEFCAIDLTSPEKYQYRHKLEGFDREWIESDYKDRTASYTNLDAGTYTFKVKASKGLWSEDERTLRVVILPPPWRSWWAYTGYSLLAVGLLLIARRNIVQRERLKSSLKLEQVEREKEHFELEKAKEVDRVKTSFFTNISHEFRTPLTLIKGPVQNLLEEFSENPKVKERLKLIERNSDLLLKLINQLLDLAKLESGSLKVEKTEGDVFSFVRAIASSFESFARQKNINIRIEVPDGNCSALFDKDKLETILINLVNNAIKFTPADGKVTIKAEVHNFESDIALQSGVTLSSGEGRGEVILTVTDTGIGIPGDQQSRIFERFHQVSEAHKEVGTGIGLALVKELVALMGGTISVTSEVGKGSEFVLNLPLELVSLGLSQPAEAAAQAGKDKLNLTTNEQRITNNEQPDSAKPHILVVEDNTDLRHFIIDSLGNEFHFLEAENGKQGLDIATNEVPDLIISDVMMPEMDGITMAGKIKKDIRSSHIPLILLTAKSTEDSKLSGLQSGADDYLTKPFNKNELLLKVRNGVSRQQKLREKLRAELMSTAPRVEVLSADEQFLAKVKEGILNRLSDEQLSVESLAEDIGLSRVQLYRKITALTGMSVNELIRKLRLQKASQLLEQNWGPVSQVAYEVGFSNLSYFSKVFKEEFGVLPSEFRTD